MTAFHCGNDSFDLVRFGMDMVMAPKEFLLQRTGLLKRLRVLCSLNSDPMITGWRILPSVSVLPQ